MALVRLGRLAKCFGIPYSRLNLVMAQSDGAGGVTVFQVREWRPRLRNILKVIQLEVSKADLRFSGDQTMCSLSVTPDFGRASEPSCPPHVQAVCSSCGA